MGNCLKSSKNHTLHSTKLSKFSCGLAHFASEPLLLLLLLLIVAAASIQINTRKVTRAKSKSGAMVKHQRVFVILKTTSNVESLFKSGAAPLYCSLVTSLNTAFVEDNP